ncbi:hypothetical protein [Microcoleus sp. Pol12B4]|uniref:hypothetical protein n=1 Tax=Microcoleus sp. Pol12B4 TaxID=3055395 RepID=UPI002FCEC1A6
MMTVNRENIGLRLASKVKLADISFLLSLDDRTLGKGTIAIHPRDYQTALRYWAMGFKSISSLEVSILNK